MEDEVKKIMLDKLREMSEITLDDYKFSNEDCYSVLCNVMNEIAQTLLEIPKTNE